MNFVTTIPRATQPRFREGSAMRSNRDSDTVARSWDRNRQSSGINGGIANALSKMQTDINRIKRRTLPFIPSNETFFPFKIYQPNLATLPYWGVIFSTSGVGKQIAIDSTKPTNLTADAPTVNPKTDGWRILAVRNGRVQCDWPYALIESGAIDVFEWNRDWGFGGVGSGYISGVDGIGSLPYVNDGNNTNIDSYGENTTTIYNNDYQNFNGCPIVFDGEPGGPEFVIWLQIVNPSNQDETSVGGLGQIAVCASSSGYWPPDSVTYPDWNPYASVLPIGSVWFDGDTTIKQITQLTYNHFIDETVNTRYTNATIEPYMTDSELNYCGDWQDDNVSPIYIQNRAFQPGDVISYTQPFVAADPPSPSNGQYTQMEYTDSASNTVTICLTYSITYLLMMTGTGFTSDPLYDSNWIILYQAISDPQLTNAQSGGGGGEP